VIAPLIFAAAVSAAPPPPQPELWRGATVGMTLAQVQELFPTGHAVAGLGVEGGGTPGWAMAESVYGLPGTATFYFAGGTLREVLVSVTGVRPVHTADNLQVARNLEAALSGYYGKAAACVDSSARGLTRLDCDWSARGVRVGLSYQDLGGRTPTLDVAVRPVEPPKRRPGALFGHKARRG
jgi:hypothetical protein